MGGTHKNSFGFLRLFFASLVIVSHSAEMLDGDRSREPLTRTFGTLSFGELAVDGFFLISGYLIVQSFERAPNLRAYFSKRVLRIYPGFIVASLVCLFVVAPLAGAALPNQSAAEWSIACIRIALLLPPKVQDAFAGLPYPGLDEPLWTIAYEFRCYVLVALLGVSGLLKRRWLVLTLAISLLVLNAFHLKLVAPFYSGVILGGPDLLVRLLGIFLCGSVFYLFRERIRYTWPAAVLSALLLVAMMFNRHLAEAGLAVLGGYLVFWFAFNVRFEAITRIGQGTDISYGVYLYAFPIMNLLIWNDRAFDPNGLAIRTFVFAVAAGFASWVLVEKPAMHLKSPLVRTA